MHSWETCSSNTTDSSDKHYDIIWDKISVKIQIGAGRPNKVKQHIKFHVRICTAGEFQVRHLQVQDDIEIRNTKTEVSFVACLISTVLQTESSLCLVSSISRLENCIIYSFSPAVLIHRVRGWDLILFHNMFNKQSTKQWNKINLFIFTDPLFSTLVQQHSSLLLNIKPHFTCSLLNRQYFLHVLVSLSLCTLIKARLYTKERSKATLRFTPLSFMISHQIMMIIILIFIVICYHFTN